MEKKLALAQAYDEHIERATCVWEPTPNGWTSRPVTKADIAHWKELSQMYRTGNSEKSE
jgi:hypothetical protein